jgi:hypothetical protein
MKTSTGIPKGYSRLLGFRTSLISFNVHRIYTYETDQFGSKKNKGDSVQAHRAESSLHELITNKYNPKVLRIDFSNGSVSEWFDVPETKVELFLSFCDDAIYNKIFPNVLSGTYFKEKSSGLIKEIIKSKTIQSLSTRVTRSGKSNIPSILVEPKVIGLEKTKTGLITTKINARQVNKHSSKYALSQSQRIAMDDQVNRKKIKDKKNLVEKNLYRKDVQFWKQLFMPRNKGLQFFIKEVYIGDDGKFPNKKITNVFLDSNNKFIIKYEPSDMYVNIIKSERYNYSGYLSINEMLDNFPNLKQNNLNSYVYFQRVNKINSSLVDL